MRIGRSAAARAAESAETLARIRTWIGPAVSADGTRIQLLANVQDGAGARTAVGTGLNAPKGFAERVAQEIARLAIPAFHHRPSAPTNLTLHQAIDVNVPIGCGDAPVFPGDVIVGDADGVVVLPAHLAAEIADEAQAMTAFEDFVTEQVMAGRSIVGLYPATEAQTHADFAAWRQANGR